MIGIYYIQKELYTPICSQRSMNLIVLNLRKKQEIVKNLYFTPERIQEIKEEMCKKIMETPLMIECVDSDGGYRVEESELLENL